jgi:glucose-1-phosphatase
MKNPILILDLGNVVFPIRFEKFDVWLNSCKGETVGEFEEQFHKIYVNYERGDFDTQVFMNRLRSELNLTFNDEKFREMWVSIWVEDTVGITEVVSDFKDKISCYVLSNTNALHIEHYLKTKPILSMFKKLYLSHELKSAKPESEIYKKVTIDLDCEPEQIIFFDDKSQNIESAKAYGWDAHVFENADQVRSIVEDRMN